MQHVTIAFHRKKNSFLWIRDATKLLDSVVHLLFERFSFFLLWASTAENVNILHRALPEIFNGKVCHAITLTMR